MPLLFRPLASALALALGLGCTSPALATIEEPARRIEEIMPGLGLSPVKRLPLTRMAVTNYYLWLKDFAPLREKVGVTLPEILKEGRHIRRRLNEQQKRMIRTFANNAAAWISPSQSAQTLVNTPIVTELNVAGTAGRPVDYGRAHLVEVPGGVVDVKGTGSVYPQQLPNSNGIMYLGEALREHLYAEVEDMVLRHAGSDERVVGSYGVADFPFEGKRPDQSLVRAGAQLRQADRRLRGHHSASYFERARQIEAIFRYYGLTTTGQRRHAYDETNLQSTVGGALIDQGTHTFASRFERPVLPYTLLDNLVDALGRTRAVDYASLLSPNEPGFPQPNPIAMLPAADWLSAAGDTPVPAEDAISRRMYALAEKLRDNVITPEMMEEELEGILDRVEQKLQLAGRPAPLPPALGPAAKAWRDFKDGLINESQVFAVLEWRESAAYDPALELTAAELAALPEMEAHPSLAYLAEKLGARHWSTIFDRRRADYPEILRELAGKSPSFMAKFFLRRLGTHPEDLRSESRLFDASSYLAYGYVNAQGSRNLYPKENLYQHGMLREAVKRAVREPERLEELRGTLAVEAASGEVKWRLRAFEHLRLDGRDDEILRLLIPYAVQGGTDPVFVRLFASSLRTGTPWPARLQQALAAQLLAVQAAPLSPAENDGVGKLVDALYDQQSLDEKARQTLRRLPRPALAPNACGKNLLPGAGAAEAAE